MYCKKCGKPNDNDAIFCKSCGTRLGAAATYQPKPNVGTSTKRAKKKFPVKIIVAVIAVAILVTSIALFVRKGGNTNYENVVEQYIEAGYSHDGKKFLSLFPNTLVDEIYRRSGATKEDVRAYYSNMLSSHMGQPSFSRVKEGDKWSFSFEITKCYDHDDYDVQSYENSYQNRGVNLKIDAAKAVYYSVRLTQNDMERDIGRCVLNLIQVGGNWYVNDYLMQDIFFWESFDNDGVRDFSVINKETEEKEDRDLIAKYLGCSTDNLPSAPDEMIDGNPHSMFYYVDSAAHRSDYRLYVLHDGNNAHVMAYYPWTVSSTSEAYSIPVEELPEDERDNSWKITFTNTAEPQDTGTIEPDDNIASTFPDEGKNNDWFRWVGGFYHQVHFYPMTMVLLACEIPDSQDMRIYFMFTIDDVLLAQGYAYHVSGGDDKPRFEGILDDSSEPISIEHDGYNFIVNCDADVLSLDENTAFSRE